jgi:uridine kinase
MFFVFIGGASASGKSGISEHLLVKLRAEGISVRTLNMDDYFLERSLDVDPELYRLITNFDLPKMLDLPLLQEHTRDLSQGKSIKKPLFKFATNRREGEEEVHPAEVIIIEGIFAQYFYKKYMSPDIPSLNVNVTTDSYNDTVDRRVKRDVASRGREKKVVIQQEHKFVGPGFFQYTASSATGSDLYINNTRHATIEEQNAEHDVAVQLISDAVKAKRASAASSGSARGTKPDVRELVAKSHLAAGTAMIANRKFTGFFNGALGEYQGTYERVFPEEAAAVAVPSL